MYLQGYIILIKKSIPLSVDSQYLSRLSGGKEGVGGRNCRPTAAARSAAFSKASGVDLRGKTTGVNEGTKRSEVGFGILKGWVEKSQ